MNKSNHQRLLGFIVAFIFLFVLPGLADAQRRSPTRIGRNSTAMKETLEILVEPISRSICQFRDGNSQVALGTVVSADGLIVTKLSEVEPVESLTCVLKGGQKQDAKIIAKSERLDLALVRIDAAGLSPIEFPEEVALTAGNIVLSANEKGRAISMGIATVSPRRFEMRQPRPQSSGRGFLGVECSPVERGLEVGRVTAGSGAQKAGLRRSDILIAFEGKKVPSVRRLIELLEAHAPNDQIEMMIVREEESRSLTVTLGKVPSTTSVQDRWGGGPFSERRFGFPSVVAHDCAIKPSDCGGPLLNSDGKVVGINIARALRVSTYAIPIAEVAKFVQANKDLEE